MAQGVLSLDLEARAMKEAQALIVAALLAVPVACSHDERPAESPQQSTAGTSDSGPSPAPATTNEPNDVESPKLNESPRQSDPTGTSPISDSRARTTPFLVAQPGGGQGGFGGMPFGGTGGSIITSRN
jgi:hypothetical protein